VRGVDMHFYSRRLEVMEKASLIRDDKLTTFLYVGRVVEDKGINELCEAFDKLSKEYPQTRLLLVGFFEDELNPVSERAMSLMKSNPAIEYVGEKWGEDLLPYYAAADCFVLPSYREGFPNTVLEAGAMGLPSIVTDINGSREIIMENENGYIVPPRDADALLTAMQRMVRDDRRRSYMASHARNMIRCRFEQGFVRQCLFDFYDIILEGDQHV